MATPAAAARRLPREPRGALVLFGTLMRYSLRNYLLRLIVVLGGLLLVALTIDLIKQGEDVAAALAQREGLSAVHALSLYSLMRLPDLAANLLVVATFLTVLWWEIQQNMANERPAIWCTGRSPTQGLVAALVFGAMVGALQFGIDVWLKPKGVTAQIEAQLGKYGRWFDRERLTEHKWIAVGSDLLRARFRYKPKPELHDVTLYRLSRSGTLQGVVKAQRARPTPTLGIWQFERMVRWDPAPAVRVKGSEAETGRSHRLYRAGSARRQQLLLDLDPLWVRYLDIHAEFLPHRILQALAAPNLQEFDNAGYRTSLFFRYTRALLPPLVALLAASLALMTSLKRLTLADFALVFLTGYTVHALTKLVMSFGELGYVAPIVASWIMPVLLVLAVIYFQARLRFALR